MVGEGAVLKMAADQADQGGVKRLVLEAVVQGVAAALKMMLVVEVEAVVQLLQPAPALFPFPFQAAGSKKNVSQRSSEGETCALEYLHVQGLQEMNEALKATVLCVCTRLDRSR